MKLLTNKIRPDKSGILKSIGLSLYAFRLPDPYLHYVFPNLPQASTYKNFHHYFNPATLPDTYRTRLVPPGDALKEILAPKYYQYKQDCLVRTATAHLALEHKYWLPPMTTKDFKDFVDMFKE